MKREILCIFLRPSSEPERRRGGPQNPSFACRAQNSHFHARQIGADNSCPGRYCARLPKDGKSETPRCVLFARFGLRAARLRSCNGGLLDIRYLSARGQTADARRRATHRKRCAGDRRGGLRRQALETQRLSRQGGRRGVLGKGLHAVPGDDPARKGPCRTVPRQTLRNPWRQQRSGCRAGPQADCVARHDLAHLAHARLVRPGQPTLGRHFLCRRFSVLDVNGVLRYKQVRGQELDNAVATLLAETEKKR